jgi:HK97 family phage major capsid protein
MVNVLELKQQSVELKREASQALSDVNSGKITQAEFTQKMLGNGDGKTGLQAKDKEIGDSIKAYSAANAIHGAGGDSLPEGMQAAGDMPQSVKAKRAQENWVRYKSLQKMAAENSRAIVSGETGKNQGSFSFDLALKQVNDQWAMHLPDDHEYGMKAQGVAGLQGVTATGTTVPPTGTPAPGAYFLTGGGAATLVEPEFEPGIAELRFYPNVIESLFPSMPVSGGVVSYVKQTAMNNNAAATPEGATKPTSSIAVARYTDTIGKITNLERVTDETIEDAPQFWALVQQDGVLGVSRKFEVELLAGTGMPGINGLLNRNAPAGGLAYPSGFLIPTTVTPVTNIVIGGGVGAGASSSTVASITPGRKYTLPTDYTKGTAMAEALLTAVTDIRVTYFFEPDAMVVNPVNWQDIRLAKDANGQYLGGSFFGTNYGVAANAGQVGIEDQLLLWNKRVISTPVQPLNLPIVGDFRDGGKILRRGGMRVDVTNMNGFDFEQNLWTMRAEIRAGLQVKRPELFEIVQFA